MTIRKPQPPSAYRSRQPETLEDLRKLTQYLRDQNDYLAAQLAGQVTSFNGRTGAVMPTSGDYTASLVGLGNVTNDAQLKRADNDWSGFTTQAGTPASGDKFLIERASDGAKRIVLASSLGSSNYPPAWSYSGLKSHFVISSALGSAGTQVATLTDSGTAGKNLTQATAALRPTVGVDANGLYYIAGNGTSQWMEAASAADWLYLCGGSPFTTGMVLSYSGPVPNGQEMFYVTTEQGVTSGSALFKGSTASNDNAMFSSNVGNGSKQNVNWGQLQGSGKMYAVVIRHIGPMGAWGNATTATQTPRQYQMWVNGSEVASSAATAGTNTSATSGYYGTAGARPLAIFARHLSGSAVPNADFATIRLYDFWLTDSYLTNRQLASWFEYARTTWGADIF